MGIKRPQQITLVRMYVEMPTDLEAEWNHPVAWIEFLGKRVKLDRLITKEVKPEPRALMRELFRHYESRNIDKVVERFWFLLFLMADYMPIIEVENWMKNLPQADSASEHMPLFAAMKQWIRTGKVEEMTCDWLTNWSRTQGRKQS